MPTAKKKSRKLSEFALRTLANEQMEAFKVEAKERYTTARKLYEKQDDETQEALDKMTALLCRIARKNMWVGVGKKDDRIVLQIPEETIYANMFYMANEILKDLALFDIRVATYTFPPDTCVECGHPAKPKKAKKKVKS